MQTQGFPGPFLGAGQTRTDVAKTVEQPPIVIVGAGLVGMYAARELLRGNPKQRVLIYGGEPWEPYNRMRLSELLAGSADWGEIVLPLDVGDDKAIRLMTNRVVTAIDPVDRSITDAQGNRQSYSRLILATGSRAGSVNPGGRKLPGVYAYRNIDDVRHLLVRAAQSDHIVVLGGGVLGIEAAFALRQRNSNVRVTLIHRNAYLMNRELDPETADFLLGEVERACIQVRLNTDIAEYIGEMGLQAVQLSDGHRLDCDALVVCAGVSPNLELARKAGLNTARGVQVNEYMQTSDPYIYAIGDCIEFNGRVYGVVGPGMRHAKVATDNILCGNRCAYRDAATTFMQVKIKHLPVFSLHSSRPIKNPARVATISYRDESTPCFRQLSLYRGRIVGARVIGGWDEVDLVRGAIDRRSWIGPWRRRYFLRYGRYRPDQDAVNPTQLPTTALICVCSGITRGELSAAVAGGCDSVESLSLHTGAGRLCGSCRPTLAKLVGSSAEEPALAMPGIGFILMSLGAVLLPFSALFIPGAPAPYSVDQVDSAWIWLRDDLVKQVSGYGALALMALSLSHSVNKHLKRLNFFSYTMWRRLHILMIALAGLLLLGHANFAMGENLTRLMMSWFLLLAITGFMISVTVTLERSFFGRQARSYRPWLLGLHSVLTALFLAPISVHILAGYYF